MLEHVVFFVVVVFDYQKGVFFEQLCDTDILY